MAKHEEIDFDFENDDDGEDNLLVSVLDSTLARNHHLDHALPPQTNCTQQWQQVAGTSTGARPLRFGVGIEPLPGFDTEAGQTWIYPTNYPVREYQFSIVQKGLFANTLVSLPTGLGKTFIAAVIMYNFYRWYPQGKIIFMAPTKPLVAQQIEACFNVMGIPQNHMAEMTGSMLPAERKAQWGMKRVFFLTPQVIMNDLNRGACPAELVKCLVVDEAHKALGNHAYAVVVKDVAKANRQFRVLALSATPGSDIKAVQQIINNLLISQFEIRTEESIDIMPYTHVRKVMKIVVPLNEELEDIKKRFLQVVTVYLDRLRNKRVLGNVNPENLSKFILLKERDSFRQNPPDTLPRSEFGNIESNFAMSMSLIHAYELLYLHGMRSFYNFLKGIIDGEKGTQRAKFELQRMQPFCQLMGELESKFKPVPFSDSFPSSSHARVPLMPNECHSRPYVVSHPKMQKLLEIVLEHFKKHREKCITPFGKRNESSTRVMIFSQYRDSVQEITDMLNHHRPLIKAMSFVGQATVGKAVKGLTQKLQLQVVNQFRNGGYNTLVSTCVGEEGLDIGEVDLIICYDAHKSPIRLVQRMGRTGRQREGQIIMLVTKGKEEKIYNQGQVNKRTINRTIVKGSKVYTLYQDSPRMIPQDIEPVCHKMLLTPGTFKISTNKQRDVASLNRQSHKVQKGDSPYLSDAELKLWYRYKIPEGETYRVCDPTPLLVFSPQPRPESDVLSKNPSSKLKYLSVNEWLPWQTSHNTAFLASHTKRCDTLVKTMQFIEFLGHLPNDDNSYELEMLPYLDKNDILRQGMKEGHKGLLISDFFQSVSPVKSAKHDCKNILSKPSPARDIQLKMSPAKAFSLKSSPAKAVQLKRSPAKAVSLKSSPTKVIGLKPSPNKAVQSKLSPAKATRSLQPKRLEWFGFAVEPDDDFVPLPNRTVEQPSCFAKEIKSVTMKASPQKLSMKVDAQNCDIPDFTGSEDAVTTHLNSSSVLAQPHVSLEGEEFFQLPDDIINWKSPWEANSLKPMNVSEPLIKTPPCSPPQDIGAFKSWVYGCHSQDVCKSSSTSEPPNISKASKNMINLNWNIEDCTSSSDDDLFKQALPLSPNIDNVGISLKSPVFNSKINPISVHQESPSSTERKDLFENSSGIALSKELHEPLGSEGFNVQDGCAIHSKQKVIHKHSLQISNLPYMKSAERTPENENRNLVLNFDLIESDDGDDADEKGQDSESYRSFSSDIILPSPDMNAGPLSLCSLITRCNNNLKRTLKPSPLTTIIEELPSVNSKHICLSPIICEEERHDMPQNSLLQKPPAIAASTPIHLASSRRNNNWSPDVHPTNLLPTRRAKQNCRRLNLSDEDENLHANGRNAKKQQQQESSWKQFIEEEAKVVGSECSSDEDDMVHINDVYGGSFIDDRLQPTQEKAGETSTMAMYLRSIRSPPARPGTFKLMPGCASNQNTAQVVTTVPISVYSQQPSSQESDYEKDSFCVDNDFVEFVETQEIRLRKRNAKSKEELPKSPEAVVQSKRRRVYMMEDSSATDEDGDMVKHCPNPKIVFPYHHIHQNQHLRNGQMPEEKVVTIQPTANHVHRTAIASSSSTSLNISNSSLQGVSSSPATSEAEYIPMILIDSREVVASQGVLSALRLNHRSQLSITQLSYCDYIVSNRMAVEKKLHSDVANPVLRRNLLQRIRDMLSVFERPCLIIESDRVKPNEQPRQTLPIKYYYSTLACLTQTPVKILTSQSPEQTADIIIELARLECLKGFAINVPIEVDGAKAEAMKFYLSLPSLSYAAALNFCDKFRSVRDFLKSSIEVIAESGKITRSKAEHIFKYLHHRVG